MTYLSQFPKAKLKPGAPLRPKLNPKKARAYGPGTHKHTHLQLDFNSERNVVVPSWAAGWAESRGDLRPWTQKLWAGPRGWTQTLVSSTPAALSVSVQDHVFHNAQYIFCSFLTLLPPSSVKVSSLLVMLWWRRLCSPWRPSVQEWERCWFMWRTLQDTERRWDTDHVGVSCEMLSFTCFWTSWHTILLTF